MMVTLTLQCRHLSFDETLFMFYTSHGLVRVSEIELSHIGKNSKDTDLVCK